MAKRSRGEAKVASVMREYKSGSLHTGKSKKIVRDKKQALAIALSEAGRSRGRSRKK